MECFGSENISAGFKKLNLNLSESTCSELSVIGKLTDRVVGNLEIGSFGEINAAARCGYALCVNVNGCAYGKIIIVGGNNGMVKDI